MKIGTFFSGVGSPEQAIKNLGIKHEVEFACDIDKYAKQTYLKNFQPKLFAEDITTLNMKELPAVDLLVFGFPCQAFSVAGKRKGFDDTRGTLFYDALRYLREHRPRYFIAENVKGLLNHDKGKTFQTIIDCLAKTINYQMSLMPFDNLGYHIHYKVLNTKDYGIPQNRERIFIIGIRDDEDNNYRFPKEIPLELKLKDSLQDNVDEKYYLSDKTIAKIKGYDKTSEWIADYRADEGLRIRKDNISPCLMARAREDITATPIVSVAIRDKNRSKHQTKKDKEYGDYKKNYQIEERTDNVSYCIKQSTQEFMIKNNINNRIRRLTPIECERLQGFPDNFTDGVSDTQRYKQMGNTITVNVIQGIIKNLYG